MSKDLFVCYKDRKPEDTIRIIKGILKRIGITLIEQKYESGIPGICSIRVSIKNAGEYGSNGKGTSLIYARASAYAEFIERLANAIIFHDSFFSLEKKFYNSKCVKLTDYPNHPFLGKKQKDHEFLRDFIDVFNSGNDDCLAIPYQHINSKKKEKILVPYPYLTFYGSNGMASGNSFYEMSVQAISEIFERLALSKILEKKKEALVYDNKKILEIFPKLKPIYQSLAEEGYHIKIYDCSIGLNLPVFALVIFDKKKEKYSVSFGSHPHAELAISRCFTEMFQGLTNKELKNHIKDVKNKYSNYNLRQIIHDGCGVYDRSFLFAKKPSHNYALLTKRYHSNKEMYEYYLSLCDKHHFPLYYHDASYLGLFAGQYIIPGISTIYYPDNFEFRFYRTKDEYSPLLEDFIKLKKDDQEMILELYDFSFKAYQTEDGTNLVSTYCKDYPTNFTLFFALANAICKNYKRAKFYISSSYRYASFASLNSVFIDKIKKIIESHDEKKIKQAFVAGKFKYDSDVSHVDYHQYIKKLVAIQKTYYSK
ncbi:MAG: YcaO-like family protein [Bacilli bacterium]|nr:YcaO-like family protein [Bacilli bacterium]